MKSSSSPANLSFDLFFFSVVLTKFHPVRLTDAFFFSSILFISPSPIKKKQTALSLDIMCNTVYSDVMQTIKAEDPTLPQQPIPMQAGVAAVDFEPARKNFEDVQPLSARCRHPVWESDMFGGAQDGAAAMAGVGAGTKNASEAAHGMEHW